MQKQIDGRKIRLSKTQIWWLKELAVGRDPMHSIHGRSEHGGAACTSFSLRKKGLIDDAGITDLGRSFLRERTPAHVKA
ncbi:MAG: hypothetical protein M3O30_17545 [Planctomycetota bacterium]|nr:hypothetical protein [Planctomycetota bacterium]